MKNNVSPIVAAMAEVAANTSRRLAHRLLREEAGAAIVVAAILFPVVIGGLGLGVETGYWYLTQRKLQHSADVAVHAAAARKRAGDSLTGMEDAARQVASTTGHTPAMGTLLVNTPPSRGMNAGLADSVEVEILENHPRLFSSLFSNEPVAMRARAVAQLQGGATACVLALGKTTPGAITVSGSTAVDLTNCTLASNSNAPDSLLMSGTSATLSADCAYTVGTAVTTGGLTLNDCSRVHEFASVSIDPYGDVAEPEITGSCRSRSVGSPGKETTVEPTEMHPSGVPVARFCNGLNIKGNVTFKPGLYIVETRDFTANGGEPSSTSDAVIKGNGVTFFLTNNASVQLNGRASLQLSAPESGPFSGLLFFGGRSASNVEHVMNGASGTELHGALYTPAAKLTYRGRTSGSGGCTQIIAHQVVFTGNSQLASECEAGRDILVGQSVSIVE